MDPVEVSPLAERDLAEISRTRARVSREPDDEDPVGLERRLRWLVLHNPARLDEVPPGWVLRTGSGRIVGSMFCIPQQFASERGTCTGLLSSGFYVEPEYRGLGLGIFMQYLQLGRTHLLFATTANRLSSQLWERFGAVPLAATDREWFGILRSRPFVEEELNARVGWTALSRIGAGVLGPLASVVRGLRPTSDPTARLTPVRSIDELPAIASAPGSMLAGLRDRPFVDWRFFRQPEGQVDVLNLTSGRSRAAQIVAVKHARRGFRKQIRALMVLDVWGSGSIPLDVVAGQLAVHYEGRIDAIVFRCQEAQAEADLARAGCVRRAFDVPLAWYIDRAGVLAGHALRLTPADGDMAL